MIKITVNGKTEGLERSTTIEEYLKTRQYRRDRVAVERNGEIVPKSRYGEMVLAEGDQLEIVSFVGGG